MRNTLLGPAHKMKRGTTSAGVGFSPTPWLSASLELTGYYDSHSGTGFTGTGAVGEPHLTLRAGKFDGKMGFGGQVRVWVPGKDAPSIVPGATSADLRGLFLTQAGPARVAINAGFRLDNSAATVEDDMGGRVVYTEVVDNVSVGVSEWSAATGGIRVAYPTGKLVIGAEVMAEYYVGEDAPGLAVLAQGDVRLALSKMLTAEFYVSGSKMPGVTLTEVASGAIPLIAYQPVIGAGIGLQARFGGSKSPVIVGGGDGGTGGGEDTPPPAKLGNLTGRVLDDAGQPLANATITVTGTDGKVVTATSGADGTWSVEGLPLGDVNIEVVASERIASKSVVSVREGANSVADTALAPQLPPGTIYCKIRDFSGKPVQASVILEPGGKTIQTAADGSGEGPSAPGTDSVTVSAPGYRAQTTTYVVDQNGSTIVGAELNK